MTAGFGAEAANALRPLGLAPHVVEPAPHLTAVQVNATVVKRGYWLALG